MGVRAKKGVWLPQFFGRMADGVHQALFRYMVKTGLILCAVEPGTDEADATTIDAAVDIDKDGDGGTKVNPDTEQAKADETSATAMSGEDEDDVVVTIGEESPPAEEDEFGGKPAPKWVKDLREYNRALARENRELKAKAAAPVATDAAVTVGEKPTLEGCDFDTERFEKDLTAWHERKRRADDEEAKKRKAQEDAQAAWQARLDAYGKGKAELKVKDYDDAEEAVKESLNTTQQGIILNGADNPALLVYALGKNPKKAKELAAIADPVKFAFAVAKLETQLKVTPRKSAPLPERTVRGSAPVSGAVDTTLERLRAEAERTGDMSKVVAYKRQQKSKK